jgi:inhibitor of KinA
VTFPRYQTVADHALLVEFGEKMSAEAYDQVLRLDAALARWPFQGFSETTPAFASVLVTFDPLIADHAAVRSAVEALLAEADVTPKKGAMREVLVCYDND